MGTRVFWVTGGEYQEIGNEASLIPGTEERYGPFTSEAEAHAMWKAQAMAKVDKANHRLTVLTEQNAEFWITGGEYGDIRDPGSLIPGTEERYGPYTSEKEAMQAWKARMMDKVDRAGHRLHIVGDPD